MIVDREPKPDLMNLFINVFNEQVQRLHDEGIHFTSTENGISRQYHFTLYPYSLLLIQLRNLCCRTDISTMRTIVAVTVINVVPM